jgi:copper chaperone CopZ
LFHSPSNNGIEAENDKEEQSIFPIEMSQTITVEGMTCEHCEQTVEEALEDVGGVTAATADRETESATIEGSAQTDALVSAVTEAGYDASA